MDTFFVWTFEDIIGAVLLGILFLILFVLFAAQVIAWAIHKTVETLKGGRDDEDDS